MSGYIGKGKSVVNVASYTKDQADAAFATAAQGATADSALQSIADGSITQPKLQVSNAPTNGYALTAQSGNTGGLTWAEMAAGGTTLISTTTVTSAVATVDIALPTGYGAFELFLEGVTPSSTGVSSTLSVRFSSDNGSSYYQSAGSIMQMVAMTHSFPSHQPMILIMRLTQS